jgi:hypothetical protein
LYVYASMFYETKRPKDALFIINLALKENPEPSIKTKILRVKFAISSENKG